LEFGVWGLEFRVWGWGLGVWVWGLGALGNRGWGLLAGSPILQAHLA
jgi:hypothetical protein